ncbi:hypothetical protein CC85DRAFT_284494 [Cutaneotrichosporon oleaginosum]|uniref:Uncharacterized protein n=1 Tax=Cutaneotrichosporon oleaginosum TaxID=879819 RepID=A0A0J1B765_9TREE|nr:uncharacterized protein CC85DRAFT_284494 [Cutaneotrichosporon oleaginosum]KLT43569.1 hypothetical protein CC85DRAFT_284494 [Cutaneotrichosporon oleaginosum]TXT05532.1 hypothetical protein COLE_06852 [Cutaneotrichosporon oleaginosum]
MDAAALDYPSASNTYAGSSANPALYPFFTAAPALDPQLQPALDQYGGWPQFLLNGLDTLSTLDPGDQTYPYTYPPEQYSDMCAALEGQGTGNYPATYAHPGPSEYPPLPLPLPLPLSSPATHAGLLVPASSSPPETRLATPHSQPESPAAGEPKKRRRKEKDEGKKAPPCTLPEKAKGGKRKGKQFKLAAHILEHEFYPHLTEAEKERLRGRIGGKQNKELTIIRAEREGRHFSVPRGLRCSICERFDYNCLMLRIVDYGHHAEAHLGHCAGCAGNADACTFKSNPQVRFAAYSAYYQGQTFASHGSLGHGTRVHPYESINEFTREHAIDERGPMRIKRLQEGLM